MGTKAWHCEHFDFGWKTTLLQHTSCHKQNSRLRTSASRCFIEGIRKKKTVCMEGSTCTGLDRNLKRKRDLDSSRHVEIFNGKHMSKRLTKKLNFWSQLFWKAITFLVCYPLECWTFQLWNFNISCTVSPLVKIPAFPCVSNCHVSRVFNRV